MWILSSTLPRLGSVSIQAVATEMPAKASDRPLSDTLSARSYLEPGQATHWSRHHEYPLQPTDRGLAGGLKDLEPTTESNNIEPVSMLDNDTAQEKRPKRGRPKLEPDGRVQFEVYKRPVYLRPMLMPDRTVVRRSAELNGHIENGERLLSKV